MAKKYFFYIFVSLFLSIALFFSFYNFFQNSSKSESATASIKSANNLTAVADVEKNIFCSAPVLNSNEIVPCLNTHELEIFSDFYGISKSELKKIKIKNVITDEILNNYYGANSLKIKNSYRLTATPLGKFLLNRHKLLFHLNNYELFIKCNGELANNMKMSEKQIPTFNRPIELPPAVDNGHFKAKIGKDKDKDEIFSLKWKWTNHSGKDDEEDGFDDDDKDEDKTADSKKLFSSH